jgi:ABC-type phosphate transport system substrate-binding protein
MQDPTSRRPRWGRRRGALSAGAVLAVVVLGALYVSSAAALGEQCSGSGAKGSGAFLQSRAHSIWGSGGEAGFNGSGNPFACNGSQGSGGKPTVGYVPVDSPGALHLWGADDGVLHEKAHFLGTGIAPSGAVGEEGTMLSNMKVALKSDVVVIPVTQTAIAITANPPALPAHPACTVPRISPVQLQKVFSGEIKNWRQLNAASDPALGGDCDQAITRIVRGESAGTTYQFKHFLGLVNSAGLPCTGKEKRTWAQLQAPFGGESPPNVEWPRNSSCQEGEGPMTTVASPGSEGEQGPLTYVNQHPGTITYGSLPEAEQWAPKQVIDVSNGVKFANPATKTGEANCAAAQYKLPEGFEKGVNVDWSQVYGSNPAIGEVSETAYPICTLTWDIAAADSVGLFGKGVATTIHDYLRFVVAPEGGQLSVKHAGYQDLPGAVVEAAAVAIAQIDGEEKEEEEGGGSITGTVLCKTQPEASGGVLNCPSGQGYTGIKVSGRLVPESVATFESTAGVEGTATCSYAEVEGGFNEDGSSSGGGLVNLIFEACPSTFPGKPEVGVGLLGNNDASKFVYLSTLAPQGAFVVAGKSGPVQLGFFFPSKPCYYQPTFLSGQVVNGSPTQLILQGTWKLIEGAEEICPLTLQQSTSRLTLVQGGSGEGAPLYVAAE